MKKFIIQNLLAAFFLFAMILIIETIVRTISHNAIGINDIVLNISKSLRITGICALILVVYEIVCILASGISLADFKIISKQSSSFVVNKNSEEIENIINIQLPKRLKSEIFEYDFKNKVFKTKTPVTFRSWGEIIAIKVAPVAIDRTELLVTSRPRLKTSFMDFGKSSINIHKIKSAIAKNGL